LLLVAVGNAACRAGWLTGPSRSWAYVDPASGGHRLLCWFFPDGAGALPAVDL